MKSKKGINKLKTSGTRAQAHTNREYSRRIFPGNVLGEYSPGNIPWGIFLENIPWEYYPGIFPGEFSWGMFTGNILWDRGHKPSAFWHTCLAVS